tara:strand:+ start:184 stop:1155 length:972 start_codon:yes stop_codon:yes gene_type:complete
MDTMRLVLPLLLAGFMVSSVQAEEWIMGTALTDEHEVIDNTCSDNFFSNTWKVNKYGRINGNGTLSADGTECAIENKKEVAGTRSGYTAYWILVEDRLDAASYSPEMNYPMLEGGVVVAEEGRAKDVDGNYYTWAEEDDEEIEEEYADEEIEEEYADEEIEEEYADEVTDEAIAGCMSGSATNYNSEAEVDDGSCWTADYEKSNLWVHSDELTDEHEILTSGAMYTLSAAQIGCRVDDGTIQKCAWSKWQTRWENVSHMNHIGPGCLTGDGGGNCNGWTKNGASQSQTSYYVQVNDCLDATCYTLGDNNVWNEAPDGVTKVGY